MTDTGAGPGPAPAGAPVPPLPPPTPESGPYAVSPPPPARRPWPRVWRVLGPLMVLMVVLLVAGGVAQAPYSAFAPGNALDAEPLVSVTGAKTYRHPGKIRFVTVSVYAQTRYLEALFDWLHPDIDVFPRKVASEGRSVADDARYNVVLMDIAQRSAAYQALKRMGYAVSQSAGGVLIDDVSARSPSDGKLKSGDVITHIDDFSINSAQDLHLFLDQRKGGEKIDVQVDRVGVNTDLHVKMTLGSKTIAGKRTAFLGVLMETMPRYHLPFDVSFDVGSVGGPSAGLAFTVTLIDELTAGGITHGNDVAVTGTIQPDGSVGEVGGVAQKTVAVRDAGADYFLVPASEYKIARQHAGSHLKVIAVRTLDEAVHALENLPTKKPAKKAR